MDIPRALFRPLRAADRLKERSIVAAPQGRILVVALPIGNLEDLSPRAREALSAADLVAAEDTRHTGHLMQAIGLSRPMVSLHEHNERSRIDDLLDRVRKGATLVLVSDAGTPLVSDPGYALIAAATAAGIDVAPVPGPSAVLAALAVAGLPTDRFCFEGFLPARGAARRERLDRTAGETRTQVYFESPHRIVETLEDLRGSFGGGRRAAVARELTKTFETIYRGTLDELLAIAARDANFARGEITLVVQGAPGAEPAADDAFVRRAMALLRRELPPSKAAAIVAELTGRRRSDVYAAATAAEREIAPESQDDADG
jgi:16S rRNA (cytidine1402-2'-O)-methyltransferase